MDALTLTPAWGGSRSPDAVHGGDLKGGGEAVKVGGGGDGDDDDGSSLATVPMAYWHKQRRRRTLSSQLVFPTQAPENTEEILNLDPNLCGESCGGFFAMCFFFFARNCPIRFAEPLLCFCAWRTESIVVRRTWFIFQGIFAAGLDHGAARDGLHFV